MQLTQHIVNAVRERGWCVCSRGLYEKASTEQIFTHPNVKGDHIIRKRDMTRASHDDVRDLMSGG